MLPLQILIKDKAILDLGSNLSSAANLFCASSRDECCLQDFSTKMKSLMRRALDGVCHGVNTHHRAAAVILGYAWCWQQSHGHSLHLGLKMRFWAWTFKFEPQSKYCCTLGISLNLFYAPFGDKASVIQSSPVTTNFASIPESHKECNQRWATSNEHHCKIWMDFASNRLSIKLEHLPGRRCTCSLWFTLRFCSVPKSIF